MTRQNRIFSLTIYFAVIGVVSGCAIQTTVQPVPANQVITEICILENPNVIISDFLPILQEGIQRNGFRSKIFRKVPNTCTYTLEYVAFQKWDFTSFMSEANIRLYFEQEIVGAVSYKLPSGIFGGGGVNPAKWNSTKEKMDPLLDELFKNHSLGKAQ